MKDFAGEVLTDWGGDLHRISVKCERTYQAHGLVFLTAFADKQILLFAGIRIRKRMKGVIGLKKQAVQVQCEFWGEEDAREIFLRSFRLFLTRSLGEEVQRAVQLP